MKEKFVKLYMDFAKRVSQLSVARRLNVVEILDLMLVDINGNFA